MGTPELALAEAPPIKLTMSCKHCGRQFKRGLVEHERKCKVGRNAGLAAAALRQVRRRFDDTSAVDDPDDTLGDWDPNAAVSMDVDFGEAAGNLDSAFDHNAQPWAAADALTVPPTMRDQRAAAVAAHATSHEPVDCTPIGEVDDLVAFFEKSLLDDDDDPHEFDPDEGGLVDSDMDGKDDASLFAYDYHDLTGVGGSDQDEDSDGAVLEESNTDAHADRYHPDNFDESKMKSYPPKVVEGAALPTSMYAQLDLALLLRKAGTPLYLHDKIIDWARYYTAREPKMWSQSRFLHRKELLESLSETFDTKRRQPVFKSVELGDEDTGPRAVDLPVFPFIGELLSMLHDPEVMHPDNIAEGYDLHTGLINDEEFWIHETIDEDDLLAIPTPRDPDLLLGEVVYGAKFQMARRRFCTKDHHMAVPLILFYDKATMDRYNILSTAPILASFGFLKNSVRTRRFVWRIVTLVPNLSIGKGRSKNKGADTKAEEHHKVLKAVFKEFEDIVNKDGGIKTRVNGKNVVLKIWIHFIIGDTEGHNELCGQRQSAAARPVRDCCCATEDLTNLPLECVSITRQDVADEDENAVSLNDKFSYRPMTGGNAFDNLPMGNSSRGIAACGNFESLHVFGQGIYKYAAAVLEDLVKGDSEKERLNDLFRIMSRWLERQSERDFPRRATRFNATDAGKNMTASEIRGNMIVFFLLLCTKDGAEFFDAHLIAHREKHGGANPTLSGVRQCLLDLVTYEKWVNQANPAAEVVCAQERVDKAMGRIPNALPRDEGNGWNIPKFHGASRLYSQMCFDGDGSGWTSSHGEHFHKEISNKNVRNTQKRYNSVTRQTAFRCGEGVTFAASFAHSKDKLMPGLSDDGDLSPVTCCTATTTREERSYMAEDLVAVPVETKRGVSYDLTLPPAPEGATVAADVGLADVKVKWSDRDKHASTGKKMFKDLLVGVVRYAIAKGWHAEVKVKGYATVAKWDPTTKANVTYRSDPSFRAKPWRDWAIVDSYPKGTLVDDLPVRDRPHGKLCPGWIAGFVEFTQPGFPTPGRAEDPQGTAEIDTALYVVVRCSTQTHNLDKKFVTEFELERGEVSLYILPMWAVIGPLAVVPNVHTSVFRYAQDVDSFLAIKPYRRWGDHFGDSIDTAAAYASSDDEEDSE